MRARLAVAPLILLAGCGSGGDAHSGPSRASGWVPLRPATLERTEVAAARIGRYAYVVGGFERRSGATTAAVERYDLRADRWRQVRSMPLGLNHTTAVAHRGRLYVHGGYTARRSPSSATSVLFRYDPGRDRWTRLRSSPTPRGAHAAAVIRGRLYVAAGANSRGSLRSLEVYDFARRRWSHGPELPRPARDHTTGTAAGGLLYVFAGRDRANFRVVDRYDPRRRRWRRMPSMRTPRGGMASARVGREIVVFGGENLGPGATTIAPVEAFDTRRRRWRLLAPMRTPRHGLAGVPFARRVYAIEGGPKPGFHFSSAVEALPLR